LFDKNSRDATLFDSASPTATGKGIMITGLPLSGTSAVTDSSGIDPAVTAGESGITAATVTPAA